ncbi:DUF3093 domain-containing protein [Streptomyces sp. NPDC052309]|uniref:DUF3093 domain-containing protein n=1 Tax=Streptomyces sp. NPDC052309 TaxID=3155421 RepID=UPI00341D7FCA
MYLYEERLAVPRSWWAMALCAGLGLALVALRVHPLGALAALIVGTAAVAAAIARYGARRIRLSHHSLTVGDTEIPLDALGSVEILDEQEAFLWRTRRADPHALMALRSYIPTAVRLQITDPAFGAPYLYLSTRQPMTLAAVLAFVRR